MKQETLEERSARVMEKIGKILSEEHLAMVPTIKIVEGKKDDLIIKPELVLKK